MSEWRQRALSVPPYAGAVLLVASFAFGFAAVEPPGYPNSTDTPCGRVFLEPQRWTICHQPMVKQTAWVIGLGVPGALALFVPPSLRLRGTARRTVLLLAALGAAAGYSVLAIIDHYTSSPIAFFGAACGAIVVSGLYLVLPAVERGEYTRT